MRSKSRRPISTPSPAISASILPHQQALPLEQAEQAAAGDREEGDTVRIALEQALEQLPEEDRDLIFLRYTNEVSAAETGKILGLSRFAIYRREKQILKKLRTQFDWRDFYG